MRAPVEFWVSGEPRGQPRPRAFVRNGRAAVYDSGTAEGWKGQIALTFRDLRGFEKWTGPIGLRLDFVFRRPKSHFRTGKHVELMRDDAPLYHTGKPDADNAAKAVMDALTMLGGVWGDDAQVAQLVVLKRYGNHPGCNIRIFQPEN